MLRIVFILLLGILCFAVVQMLTADSGENAASSDQIVSSTSAADSSETRPNESESSENLPPKPPSNALNSPGENFDFSSYLNSGRVTIVYFYADWCPACNQMSPLLASINREHPNIQVLFLDIGDWSTPIADRYGVRSVPYLRVYDQKGFLVTEGSSDRVLDEAFKRAEIRR